jgi:hypothetical protein
MKRNPTRSVKIGSAFLGSAHPIAVQSMCATRTQDIDATVEQAESIRKAGGDVVRVAVDNPKDVEALAEVRRQTPANLVVDLQENYRLAASVAPRGHAVGSAEIALVSQGTPEGLIELNRELTIGIRHRRRLNLGAAEASARVPESEPQVLLGRLLPKNSAPARLRSTSHVQRVARALAGRRTALRATPTHTLAADMVVMGLIRFGGQLI